MYKIIPYFIYTFKSLKIRIGYYFFIPLIQHFRFTQYFDENFR